MKEGSQFFLPEGKQFSNKLALNMKTKTFTWIKGRLLIVAFLFISTNLLAQYPAGSPVAINGKLSVIGTQLSNECGNPVQLRGMSSHGVQWYGNCVNTSSLDYLV